MMTADYQTVLADPDRLEALETLELLDTPFEAAFDRLTRLASHLVQAPVSLVSIVAADRQFFKSFVGLAEPWATRRETPLSHSFCQHVVVTNEPLVISDARENPLVAHNLAIPDLGVISYLGMPLTTSQGQALGSFCVIDTQPREWTAEEIEVVRELAQSVLTEIELRGEIKARLEAEAQMQGLIHDLKDYSHVVAHDLKNPLSSIIGFAGLLQMSADLTERDQQDVNRIIEGGRHMAAIIDELLLMARSRSLDDVPKATVDMHHVLSAVRTRLDQLIRQNDATLLIPDDLPQVFTYGAWVEEVWANYISNAIKYGGDSPCVTIGADVFEDEIHFWVKDEGEGMTPEQQGDLFRTFSRAGRNDDNGHGLGLSIVKQIVRKLGGSVGVDSAPGQGSRFWFTLPVRSEAVQVS
jgi:signal transduction histidine kinase